MHDHHVGAGLLDLGQQVAGDDDGTAAARRSGSGPRASRGSAAGRARWWARRGPAGRAGRAWPARWPGAAACPGSRCAPRGRARRRARRSPAPRRSGRPRRAAGGLPVELQVVPAGQVRQEAGALDERAQPGQHRGAGDRPAWPKIRISPASGWIRPISIRSVVVLPAPLGPSRPSTWPVLHPERQVVDRQLAVAVGLGQPADPQRARRPSAGSTVVLRCGGARRAG